MSQKSDSVCRGGVEGNGCRWYLEVCPLNLSVRNGVLVRSGELVVLVNTFRLRTVPQLLLQDGA
jgi:hypothetical protein